MINFRRLGLNSRALVVIVICVALFACRGRKSEHSMSLDATSVSNLDVSHLWADLAAMSPFSELQIVSNLSWGSEQCAVVVEGSPSTPPLVFCFDQTRVLRKFTLPQGLWKDIPGNPNTSFQKFNALRGVPLNSEAKVRIGENELCVEGKIFRLPAEQTAEPCVLPFPSGVFRFEEVFFTLQNNLTEGALRLDPTYDVNFRLICCGELYYKYLRKLISSKPDEQSQTLIKLLKKLVSIDETRTLQLLASKVLDNGNTVLAFYLKTASSNSNGLHIITFSRGFESVLKEFRVSIPATKFGTSRIYFHHSGNFLIFPHDDFHDESIIRLEDGKNAVAVGNTDHVNEKLFFYDPILNSFTNHEFYSNKIVRTDVFSDAILDESYVDQKKIGKLQPIGDGNFIMHDETVSYPDVFTSTGKRYVPWIVVNKEFQPVANHPLQGKLVEGLQSSVANAWRPSPPFKIRLKREGSCLPETTFDLTAKVTLNWRQTDVTAAVDLFDHATWKAPFGVKFQSRSTSLDLESTIKSITVVSDPLSREKVGSATVTLINEKTARLEVSFAGNRCSYVGTFVATDSTDKAPFPSGSWGSITTGTQLSISLQKAEHPLADFDGVITYKSLMTEKLHVINGALTRVCEGVPVKVGEIGASFLLLNANAFGSCAAQGNPNFFIFQDGGDKVITQEGESLHRK